MKTLGSLLIALGIIDFAASWIMQIDIYAEMGIIVPDSIYTFTPAIAIIAGGLLRRI